MQQVRIMIGMDRREYYVPADVDIAALRARVTEQLRAGGGFVDILSTADHTLSVLVSNGMSLTIEVTRYDAATVDFGDEEDGEPDPTWLSPLDPI